MWCRWLGLLLSPWLLGLPCSVDGQELDSTDGGTIMEVNDVRNPDFLPLGEKSIQHLQWKSNGTILDPYAVHIRVPPSVKETMRKFCDDMGITDLFRRIFSDPANELPPDEELFLELGPTSEEKFSFYLQRPARKWKSNMHWLNANDEKAHDLYMDHLMAGGFEQVLDALGRFYDLDGIDCYSIGFIGVSHCEKGFVHTDFKETGGKGFNILLPLYLVEGSVPEFIVQLDRDDDSDGTQVKMHYEYDAALAVGDQAFHGTAECDYRSQPGKFRMAMSIYLADVNEDNVDSIIDDYTDPFPPAEAEYLLKHAGRHWKRSDGPPISSDSEQCISVTDGNGKEAGDSTESTCSSSSDTAAKTSDSKPTAEDIPVEPQYNGPNQYKVQDGVSDLDDDEDDDDEYADDDYWDEEYVPYVPTRPFDPLDFDRNEFIAEFKCDEIFLFERPIYVPEVWSLFRAVLIEIAKDDENSYAPPRGEIGDTGFFVSVEVRQTGDHGRGVFATQFIPAGTWVWTGKYKGLLGSPALYRKLLLTLPREFACDSMSWVYIDALDVDPLKFTVETDIAVLINGVMPEEDPNLVCLEKHEAMKPPGGCKDNFYAARDIQPGEELFIRYDFYNKQLWWDIGLKCNHFAV